MSVCLPSALRRQQGGEKSNKIVKAETERTVIAQVRLVQQSALALPCNVRDPYAANAEAMLLTDGQQVVPEWLIKLLVVCQLLSLSLIANAKQHNCHSP